MISMLEQMHYFLNILFKIILYITAFMLFGILFFALILLIWASQIRDETNEKRLNISYTFDRQIFPSLKDSLFFYQRMHVGDYGSWVVVYPLDAITKNQFLIKYQLDIDAKNKFLAKYKRQINPDDLQYIECIKPTIKKRWRSWHSNIHYVQPSEWAKGHNDYRVHDSFIVYGSDKYLKTVETSCMGAKFKILRDSEKSSHRYWAIAEKENLFFSVYSIK